MATGKVRIFELAKEVGLPSKELISLFNERLGGVFEAKNQLSVVPDQIADLIRSVLLKSGAAPAKKPERAAPAAPAKAKAAPAAPAKRAAPRPAAPPAPEAPVP
ncbi:MAG TPA: translation initiation factor IF-2 N-terminal domain-containing protein, partial [Candidatus Tumulicola sp.]|nr:translation initiation factor IF-2 N-terminal domain-containing protein [Candidatus Tumulicola sp.]